MASLLEKSLSLSDNGGIYYAGARVKTSGSEAVLFVGLGGSGADALIRIKNEVVNRTILPTENGIPVADVPAGIGFLEFDTDLKCREKAYGTAHFDEFGTDFCDLGVNSLPAVIEDVKQQKRQGVECWQWFGDDVNAIAGKDGAGGIRQIGRLLLAYNIQKVTAKISGTIRQLVTDNNINKLTIFVFSGISGGTGAGTFLDMSYILRKAAKAIVPNVIVMGYLIMTDVNELNGGEIDTMRANGFACLKELDYWMASHEHEERYRQVFPHDYKLDEFERPFDFCHLMNSSDIYGHTFTYDKILKSVAENAFVYMAGESGGGNAQGNTAMTQMYNNIRTHLQAIGVNAEKPANHEFLSIGAAKVEIPYTEISTLIASRVFQRLEQGMFRNRPSKEDINLLMAKELQMTESSIRSALYRDMPAKPNFGDYKYKDIWPGNKPYALADQWLAAFQRMVIKNAGAHPDFLEGELKQFIENHLSDNKTGPIYLAHFCKSNESENIYSVLREFREYCNGLSAQCGAKTETLKMELQQSYVAGSKAGFTQKSKSTNDYIEKLEEWFKNEEQWFLNKHITGILDKVIQRIDVYYNQILKPLADTLNALPPIFSQNIHYIQVHSNDGDELSSDYLIKPLDFESTKKREFSEAVQKAEKGFLGSMATNIKKLIGKTIGEVDEVISSGADVAGFISMFISENFSELLTINMEQVMVSNLKNGESLDHYIANLTKDLIDHSYPMFKKRAKDQQSTTKNFAVISVPSDCPQILASVNQFLASNQLTKEYTVKTSEEKNRFYIVKVESGYPLFSNFHIEELEQAYEKQMGTALAAGKHLVPEWIERLPSPYIEPSWEGVYRCERTAERNKRIREVFDECVRNQIIFEDPVDGKVYLRIADKELTKGLSIDVLSAKDLPGKRDQLDGIKNSIWRDNNRIELKKYSTYIQNRKLDNIKENVLRYPLIVEEILAEGDLAKKLDDLNRELLYPSMFAHALVTHMIVVNDVTGDTSFKREENDPFPIQLTAGHMMGKDFVEYQIFSSFCEHMNADNFEEIETKYSGLRDRITVNEKVRGELASEIKNDLLPVYNHQYELAKDKMLSASLANRHYFQKITDFYKMVSDELLDRILPRDAKKTAPIERESTFVTGSQEEQVHEQTQGNSSVSPRYLDPASWRPVTPREGQEVFDTDLKKVIVFHESPVKIGRYLDPNNGWNPVNPVDGQEVFDTETKSIIIYKSGEISDNRFLDTATWKPVIPTPGMEVFDTKIKQVVTYYPGYDS